MNGCRVCVTGGSGFIGSWLTKMLLSRGDSNKVGLLKSLPNADTNLVLFQADIYSPDEFEDAIKGCMFVFHVATPVQHYPQSSQYKDVIEAAVSGATRIIDSCIRTATVKRLIYTGSVLASSPLTEDGLRFKSALDESCWSPLNAYFPRSADQYLAYVRSKAVAEKRALSYNDTGELEVVSLACALVGGDCLLPQLPLSSCALIAPIMENQSSMDGLRLLQHMLGSVPLVHINDVCEAHIFCAEQKSMRGRFLCAATSRSITEITDYLLENHPEYPIQHKLEEGGEGAGIRHDFSKLIKMGFHYKSDAKKIIDDTVECAKRLGALPAN